MARLSRLALATAAAALLLPGTADAQAVAPARGTTPVVLTGKDLLGWAVPANATAKLPLMDAVECETTVDPSKLGEGITEDGAAGAVSAIQREQGCHNTYSPPELDTAPLSGAGVAPGRLVGYRWNPATGAYRQIPFQVDEVFTRYLDNSASGFSPYSGQDQHTTYAYDREGFRWTADGPPEDPCRARPASPAVADPVPGLDTNDELAFMAADAGAKAPAGAPPPRGIERLREVRVTDPVRPADPRYVYVGLAREGRGGARPAYTASNGYVRYERDADADLYAFSQSSYSDYGNAAKGVFCDAAGNVVRGEDGRPRIERRRPRDTATVRTKRYRFRYDGRWLMTRLEISKDNGRTYGPDIVDRWKARAFAQDPGSETPCCGYEEEDTNWGGSSTLLGERVGPVRAIRETWGADSGTNVIRRETFYRDEMRQRTFLRVHPIPPLDGIYAQWDFNAGRVDRFFTAQKPSGVVVDGRNDERLGNLDDPCAPKYDANDTDALSQTYRSFYEQLGACRFPYHQSVDVADPLFAGVNAGLAWAVTAGPHGSVVDRLSASLENTTPGGAAQSLLAVPYYRDDACFDDGTGTDPGPKLKLRSGDEPATTADGTPRRCWTPADGVPKGDPRFFQGSIATHGVHLLAVAESDNARLTAPVTEIVSDWTMVMLPGRRDARDGAAYGRGWEQPLVATVAP